jgi:hypothetical protein
MSAYPGQSDDIITVTAAVRIDNEDSALTIPTVNERDDRPTQAPISALSGKLDRFFNLD